MSCRDPAACRGTGIPRPSEKAHPPRTPLSYGKVLGEVRFLISKVPLYTFGKIPEASICSVAIQRPGLLQWGNPYIAYPQYSTSPNVARRARSRRANSLWLPMPLCSTRLNVACYVRASPATLRVTPLYILNWASGCRVQGTGNAREREG